MHACMHTCMHAHTHTLTITFTLPETTVLLAPRWSQRVQSPHSLSLSVCHGFPYLLANPRWSPQRMLGTSPPSHSAPLSASHLHSGPTAGWRHHLQKPGLHDLHPQSRSGRGIERHAAGLVFLAGPPQRLHRSCHQSLRMGAGSDKSFTGEWWVQTASTNKQVAGLNDMLSSFLLRCLTLSKI